MVVLFFSSWRKAHIGFLCAKIVQGERNGKGKAKDFHFPLPSRSLSSAKIVKDGRKAKGKVKIFSFSSPIQSLFFQKTPKCGQKKASGQKAFTITLSSQITSVQWEQKECPFSQYHLSYGQTQRLDGQCE